MAQGLEKEELLKRIDSLLWQDAYVDDARSTAAIAIELSESLRQRLDDVQRAALDTARAYWDGSAPENARLARVNEIGTRCDNDVRCGLSRTRDGYTNRIVWTALNTNTGLSGFAAEFLVEIGEGAGLSIEQIDHAFKKVLPTLPRRGVS